MRVLVTGGLGFLGHAVTRALVDAGQTPVPVTSRRGVRSVVEGVETVHAHIRDLSTWTQMVREVRPEAVCHLAALTRVRDSFEEPTRYFDVNVGGTGTVLEALEHLEPMPVVFVSTGAVYGPAEGRISEDHAVEPTNPYGASKLAAEQLVRFHAATGAIGATILRCFNVAGAVDGVGDSDTTRILPMALQVAAERAERLVINGDGTAVREFTHVADVASAVLAGLQAASPGEAGVYNVGSGVESSMVDVVGVVERVTGRPVAVEHREAKPEPSVLMADSARIRADLGWMPQHSSLDEIVRDAWGAITGGSVGQGN